MLKEILNPKTCADCKLCCIFDEYDVWETPVFDEQTKNKLSLNKPDAAFIKKDGGYIFKVERFDSEGLFKCPALDTNGCILGDEKPFDCKIWPYRIMSIGEKRAITIANICDGMFHKPLSELVDFLKKGLAEIIFKYADKHPEIVKKYDSFYPILLVEGDSMT